MLIMHPGLGIIRIRYNGYNLSLIVRHPFEVCKCSYSFAKTKIQKKFKMQNCFLVIARPYQRPLLIEGIPTSLRSSG